MNLKSLVPVGRDRNAVYHPFASIYRELDRMLEDFGRGFPGLGAISQALTPATDVVETDKEIEITAELPGLEEKDVKIDLSDNVLTIRGEKRAEKEEKDKNYRMIERTYGAFARSIELPPGVDASAIKATIANGVLKVTVQKPAPAQAKTIEVKSAK